MNKQEFEQVFAAAAEKSGVAELARKNQFAENLEAMMCELRDKLNSLPAEKPSEELEEAANAYANEHPGTCLENDGGVFDDYDKPKRDFIAGAQWLKEQIMKGLCHETKVYRDEEGDGIDTPIESWLALENNEITNLPNVGLKEGDKVKILIIKEDKQ